MTKKDNKDNKKEKDIKPNKSSKGIIGFLTKNWGYKIIAVLAAVLVWAYVLNVQNPQRERRVADVPIYITGEESLRSTQRLVLATTKQELGEADVNISLPAITSINKDAISVYVDVSGIKRAGTHEVPLVYESTEGKIISVSPETISITVDEYESKEVPIQIEYQGDMPEGYWHGNAAYTPTTWTVQGAKEYVDRVQKAVCYVPLDRTTSYQDSLKVSLLDENDEALDSSNFVSSSPSVMLNMTIWPKKTVPILVEDSIIGSVPDTHEIVSITVKPSSVTVAAPQNELDQIESLDIDTIVLGDGYQSINRSVQLLKKFSDIRIVEGDRVEVHIEIAEKQTDLKLVDIPIVVRNLGKGLEVSYQSIANASIEFKGAKSLVAKLKRDNVVLFVDCKDLTAGTYELPIQLEKPDNTDSVAFELGTETVSVTLKEKNG